MRSRWIGALLLVALMGACGSATDGGSDPAAGGGSSGSPGSDAPVTMTPDPGAGDPSMGGRQQRTRPRPGMADLRPVAWEDARLTPSGRALRVTYWSGVEPCNVLDHVDVRYETKRVVVTLYEGHDPDDSDTACIEIALKKVVRINLDEPLDGRDIVDGAR